MILNTCINLQKGARRVKKRVFGVLVVLLALVLPAQVWAAARIVHWNLSAENDAWLERMAERFREETGIEVVVEYQPASELHEKLTLALAAGIAPDSLTDHSGYGAFAHTEWFADLRPFVERDPDVDLADFIAASVEGLTVPEGMADAGKLIGIPWSVWGLTFARNATLWDEAGIAAPPQNWTWEEFLSYARRLRRDTDGDGITDVWGVTMPINETRMGPIVHNAAIYWFDRHVMPTRSTILDSRVLRVLEEVRDLFASGVATQDRAAYRNGRGSAIDTQASPAYHDFLASNQARNEFLRRPVAPGGKSGTELAVISLGIMESSANKAAAWEWIRFVTTSYDYLVELSRDSNYNRMPARLDVARVFFEEKTALDSSFLTYFAEVSSPESYPRLEHPESVPMSNLIEEYLVQAIEAQTISVQEAALQIYERVEPMLAAYR